jgi:hypothetical protein
MLSPGGTSQLPPGVWVHCTASSTHCPLFLMCRKTVCSNSQFNDALVGGPSCFAGCSQHSTLHCTASL